MVGAMETSDAENRIRAAVDQSLDKGGTTATCSIADLVDVLEQLSRVRHQLLQYGEPE